MWSCPSVKFVLMGLLILLSGCGSFVVRDSNVGQASAGQQVGVNPGAAQPLLAQTETPSMREQPMDSCQKDLRSFSKRMSENNFADAGQRALDLFANARCPATVMYSPVWSMLDISRDDKFIRTFITQARKSSLAEDSSLSGQAARNYLTAVELYLTGSRSDEAKSMLKTIEFQLSKGAYSGSPELQSLARAQILFLYGVIADLTIEQAAFDACVAYWESPDQWTPQELKTGLYYQLASRIQKALTRIWSGLGDMHAQRQQAAAPQSFDPMQAVVSPKLFEARVLIDELFYEYSKPDFQPIVEEFRIELLPELALKGVNDIIDAYYTKTDQYKGQFQSGIAYLTRARELSDPFLQDVRRRIASSRHSACASQF